MAALAVPSELAPWLPGQLVVVSTDADPHTPSTNGFAVAVTVVICNLVMLMTALSVAPLALAFTTQGKWPYGPEVVNTPCSEAADAPEPGAETVPSNVISYTPYELDQLLLGALEAGPWGRWLKDAV